MKKEKIKKGDNIISKIKSPLKIFNVFKTHTIISIIVTVLVVAATGTAIILFNLISNKTTKDICTVNFDSSGGTAIKENRIKCGSAISKPEDPIKEGFIFKRWEYNDKEYKFDSPVLVDLLLTAIYGVEDGVEIVKITFDTSGASEIKPAEIKKDTVLTKPVDPVMSGYKFVGWYKDYVEYDFSTVVNENITLKAKWEEVLSNSNEKKEKVKTNTSSNKYKCRAEFRSDVPEKNVTTEYSDHVNWTWSTNGSYSNDCYITYKTSNADIATVSAEGIITAKKAGKVYISECANDSETKKELICFKGKLNITMSEFEQDKQMAINFANSVNGYYWYLDGDNYGYLHPTIMEWYDHTILNWDSKYIALINNKFVTSSSTNTEYIDDSNIHNTFLLNPTELGYGTIKQYNMKVSGNKLYITIGGKTYSFTKNGSAKDTKASISISPNNITIDKGKEKSVDINISPSFVYHYIDATSSDYSVASCSCSTYSATGKIKLNCGAYQPGTVNITVRDTIGGKTNTLKITVNNVYIPVTGVSLNTTNVDLVRGNTYSLVATVVPNNADNKNVIWNSSDNSIVTVSNGTIRAVGSGNATITATTQDGNKQASCNIIVTNPPLTGSASIGISSITSGAGITRGVSVNVNASGGTGSYNYYFIKLYKDGTLISETSNTSSKSLFASGHTNGNYYTEFEIHDSDGNIYNGISGTTTVSGY